MTIFRQNGHVRRSAGENVGRCCCGGCIVNSGVWGNNATGQYMIGTCLRALIWKNLTWTRGALAFDQWVGGVLNPDIVLRIARRRSGVGHSRRCWDTALPYNYFPVISRCWDYNPCTGLGNLSWPGFSAGDENLFFTPEMLSQLNARAGSRFVAGLFIGINCYGLGESRRDFQPYTPDCCGLTTTHLIPYYQNYSSPVTVDWTLSIFSPTEEEEEEIDNAAIPPNIVFEQQCN